MTSTAGAFADTTNPVLDDQGKLKIVDLIESLTGYEEDNIETRYGAVLEGLSGTKYVRALYYVWLTRTGVKDGEAYKRCQTMTQAQVTGEFADPEPDDGDDDEAGSGVEDVELPADPPGDDAAEPKGAPVAPTPSGRAIADDPQA